MKKLNNCKDNIANSHPKLRFRADDGSHYPDWEEKRLGGLISCLDHKRKPLNSEQRANITGIIPYYGANGVVDYIADFIFNEELVLLAEDGGNFDDYKNKPIAQYITGKAWVNNHAHVIKGKDSISTKFIFYSLVHKDIRAWINGTSRSKLNKTDMLCIIVNVPLSVKEQQKIADCLTSIDDSIQQQTAKLEQIELYKKSLLQQMLI
jgi:type I restriction enzyme S subunit